MRVWIVAAAVAAALASGAPAHAQMLKSLRSASGIGGGIGGGMGGMSMPSLGSASSGNIAGVLQYCIKNNYLGSGNAATTEGSLLGKLGQGTVNSSQYQSGSQGQLQTGNNQTMSLGAGGVGGLKAKLTQKVCDQVLKHAKSML